MRAAIAGFGADIAFGMAPAIMFAWPLRGRNGTRSQQHRSDDVKNHAARGKVDRTAIGNEELWA
jgi:hypothetical protein